MRLTSESDNHPDTLVVPTRRRVAVANLDADPEPLVPLYLRRPDAVEMASRA